MTIDREKALALGLPLSEITSALQIFLGSQYVNDFEFNNRAYRVYVQADQRSGRIRRRLKQLYARTRTGEMVPLDQVVRCEETTSPQVISHFNLFRSATINGSAAPGRELRAGAAGDGAPGARPACPGMGASPGRGSRSRRPRPAAVGRHLRARAAARLPDAAAQYESLVLPFIILLGVPLAVLGALARSGRAGFPTTSTARSGWSC